MNRFLQEMWHFISAGNINIINNDHLHFQGNEAVEKITRNISKTTDSATEGMIA